MSLQHPEKPVSSFFIIGRTYEDAQQEATQLLKGNRQWKN